MTVSADSRKELAARVLVALALAIPVARATTAPISGADVGWVVAAGRTTLATGAAPTTNMFSFVAKDHPWIMHEWLFGPLYALGFGSMGFAFFAFISGLACFTVGLLLATRAFREVGRPAVAAVWVALLVSVFFDRLMLARPTGFVALFAIVMIAIAFRPTLGVGTGAGAVLVELCWTNLHGSFPLGLVILLAATIDASSRRGHLATLALATAATAVNPYGLRLHAFVVRYALATDGTIGLLRQKIREFSPVWRANYHDVVTPAKLACICILLLVAMFATVRSLRSGSAKARAAPALALLLFLGALLQARNADLAGLAGSFLLFGALPGSHSRSQRRSRVVAVPAGLVGAAALAWTMHGRAPDDWVSPSMGGAPFVRLARSLPNDAKVYVPFRSAGLLLMTAAERGVTTFYDSRNDCYPEAVARIGLDAHVPSDVLVKALVDGGATHAIVPSQRHVATHVFDVVWPTLERLEPAFRASPAFEVATEDGGWIVFVRRDAAAAK